MKTDAYHIFMYLGGIAVLAFMLAVVYPRSDPPKSVHISQYDLIEHCIDVLAPERSDLVFCFSWADIEGQINE